MKILVLAIALLYPFLMGKALVQQDKASFRLHLFCWVGMMGVVYFAYFYCKGGEENWLLFPFFSIWPRR